MIDFERVKIETERLILREWNKKDLNDLYEYAKVPNVGEMAGWNHHESIEESERILNEFISEKKVLAITLKENGKAIGALGQNQSWAEKENCYANLRINGIGYAISKDFWGRGITAEATKAVIKYFFDNDLYDAVAISHFKDNLQSKRVIEKCGFKFVKEGIYYSNQMNKHFDALQYILFKDEK